MNKTKLKQRAKEILNKYTLDSFIHDLEDIDFLLSIFQNHPDWLIKKGVGIESISIKKTETHNTRCFFLNRIDKSTTDISYIQSITPTTKYYDIRVACRTAIRDTVIDFKRNNFISEKTICEITKDILTHNNVHVDHYDLTFDEMFKGWIENKDKDFLLQNISNVKKDNETDIYFTDLNIKNDFVKYHNSNTNLRLVSKKANLSILKSSI